MKKLFYYPVLLMTLASSLLLACSDDKEEDVQPKVEPEPQPQVCDTNNVTFSGTVAGILNSNCTSCHNASLANGGVTLDTYAGAKIPAQSGKLLGVINHASGYPAMPQGGAKLSDCNIAKIKKWVDAGAPNN
ncbi:MAG: c-type cytochrome [Rufibacter sp.]